jgi:hypothetical protein
MATFKGFDMAVGATILGIIVSITIWQINSMRGEEKTKYEQEKQRIEEVLDVERYEQELRMKLHTKLLDARNIEQLKRIERSLYWIEENQTNRTDRTRDIIVSFREAIIKELQFIENTQELVAENKTKLDATIDAMEKKNAAYQDQVEKNQKNKQTEFIQPTGNATKHFQIKSITCDDPQSNWPKRCDSVYFSINNKPIWKESLKICRGETLEFAKRFSFNTQTILQLKEEDLTKDDLLDEINISKLEQESSGQWIIDGKSNKGEWHYVIEYEVISL